MAEGSNPSARRTRDEPPPGPPWDDPIEQAPFVFLDLEMTGLRPATDRVIEICAVRVRAAREEGRLETLVRPESGAFGNAHVHGIDPASLAGAPLFAELCEPLERLLDGAVPVAHAAGWDVGFVEAELARAGRPRTIPHYLDTLALTRRAFALPSHSLSSLCTELGIARARAHRAADDVQALREVWSRVIKALSPKSPRDLWHVRIAERHARPEVVAAALRAAELGRPVRVRYRPARKGRARAADPGPGLALAVSPAAGDADRRGAGPIRAPGEELVIVVTSVRTDLDPPRVLGYLLPSRSRRELRADRILAIEAMPERGEDGT